MKNERGLIFDIKQFAVFDGPGIRTTVFLKGCPMRCQWCHNPEGIDFHPQLMVSNNSCIHCGRCSSVCSHPERCIACGACIDTCPLHLRKISRIYYTASELAALLLRDKDFLEMNQGGITLSGGEPLAQPIFVYELLEHLKKEGIHTAIETSGYCSNEVFKCIISGADYVIMDVKLVDRKLHRKYTGVDNVIILRNLEYLKSCGKEFVVRIPLIPGVNDTNANLAQTALLLRGAEYLTKVELLPYHKTAGAKYGMLGMKYNPDFDVEGTPNCNKEIFESLGISCQF
ncbi:MAG: glycyl-radical enzyme activating protein [Clostridiaceae bacterium]|nr:glycyl-radical enzyme activating protein [Clostridiaceae bacterium]